MTQIPSPSKKDATFGAPGLTTRSKDAARSSKAHWLLGVSHTLDVVRWL